MGDIDQRRRCDLCKIGTLRRDTQDIAFHQSTDKGEVSCRVTIPIYICDQCGAKSWGDAAEALLEEAVRQEYQKLK